MCYILSIETSTKVCSVALSKGKEILSLIEDNSLNYSHSSKLTNFIDKVMKGSSVKFNMLDCVAVSGGPGSYTGLRIGVSTAKGICFALDIPLININTLKSLANVMLCSENIKAFKNEEFYLSPMIDARRMEVFNAIFDDELNIVKDVSADIIDSDSYKKFLKEKPVLFFGNGAMKCKEVINSTNTHFFDDIYPSASGMVDIAYTKFVNKEFENTAYFEPFYLKDFIAGKPKVKGLFN